MRSYKMTFALIAALLGALMGLVGPLADVADYAPLAVHVAYAQTPEPGEIVVDTTPPDVDVNGGLDNPITDNPIDINAQIAMWLAVLGFISTFAISFINRALPGISPNDAMKRGIVAALFCVLVGFLDVVVRGTLNATNFTASALLVFSTAIGFYNLWFKNSAFAAKIEGKETVVVATRALP